MKNRLSFLVIVFMLAGFGFVNAQQISPKKLLENSNMRTEIINQLLSNHDYEIELMNKITSDNNIRNNLMKRMFMMADIDTTFRNQMFNAMMDHESMRFMIRNHNMMSSNQMMMHSRNMNIDSMMNNRDDLQNQSMAHNVKIITNKSGNK